MSHFLILLSPNSRRSDKISNFHIFRTTLNDPHLLHRLCKQMCEKSMSNHSFQSLSPLWSRESVFTIEPDFATKPTTTFTYTYSHFEYCFYFFSVPDTDYVFDCLFLWYFRLEDSIHRSPPAWGIWLPYLKLCGLSVWEPIEQANPASTEAF